MNKDEIITLAKELKKKAPSTNSATAFAPDPSPQRFTAQENAVIEELMTVILQHSLSADHAETLLARTIQLLEWSKLAANKTPEANA